MTAGSSTRHRWGRALILLALVLGAAGVLGAVNPGGLVWVDRLLDHPYPMGVAAAVLMTVGIRFRVDRVLPRLALGAIFLATGIGWGTAWLLAPADVGAIATSRAPERAGYEAVVVQVGSPDDRTWLVTVRQTGTLLAREWAIGCVREVVADGGFDRLRWASPDRLVVELEKRSLGIDVDPRTGRPARGIGPGWTPC